MKPLTSIAHDAVAAVVSAGDIVIDATAGNGHDTQFLAELVRPHGHVFAVDIQQQAINSTATQLTDDQHSVTTLLCGSHAELLTLLPERFHGRVRAVMFNLGYLPGGDKTVITNSETTLAAVQASLQLLSAGGLLSIMAYVGHAGGQGEADAVRELLKALPENQFEEITQPDKPLAPRLFLVKKLKNA